MMPTISTISVRYVKVGLCVAMVLSKELPTHDMTAHPHNSCRGMMACSEGSMLSLRRRHSPNIKIAFDHTAIRLDSVDVCIRADDQRPTTRCATLKDTGWVCGIKEGRTTRPLMHAYRIDGTQVELIAMFMTSSESAYLLSTTRWGALTPSDNCVHGQGVK